MFKVTSIKNQVIKITNLQTKKSESVRSGSLLRCPGGIEFPYIPDLVYPGVGTIVDKSDDDEYECSDIVLGFEAMQAKIDKAVTSMMEMVQVFRDEFVAVTESEARVIAPILHAYLGDDFLDNPITEISTFLTTVQNPRVLQVVASLLYGPEIAQVLVAMHKANIPIEVEPKDMYVAVKCHGMHIIHILNNSEDYTGLPSDEDSDDGIGDDGDDDSREHGEPAVNTDDLSSELDNLTDGMSAEELEELEGMEGMDDIEDPDMS